MLKTEKITISIEELKVIRNLLSNESATRKNHLVSAVLSNDEDYKANAIPYAQEIEKLRKTYGKINGAVMALEGSSYHNGEKKDVEFFAYS